MWIAFNLVSLHLQKQPYKPNADGVNKLWIAFNLVSLHLQKQPNWQKAWEIRVVNCFQFSIFAFAKTTNCSTVAVSVLLWIAFNLVSLHLQKQLAMNQDLSTLVVNCFQFSIFAFAKTTRKRFKRNANMLWIAFNLVSLHLQKQRYMLINFYLLRCELLSI